MGDGKKTACMHTHKTKHPQQKQTQQQNEDDGFGLFGVTDSSSTTMSSSSSSMPDLRRVVAPADVLRLCAGGNIRIPSSENQSGVYIHTQNFDRFLDKLSHYR